jgi:hypothetical protein
MAWREDLHPRDAHGRFAHKGALPAISIKATLANLRVASDDELMDVYHRLSATKRLDTRKLAAIDAELARREGAPDLAEPDDTPEQLHVDQLVARGYSYAEAYAEAYGTSGRDVDRDQAAALVDRRKGETLEQARRRAYAEMVTLQALQAEEATRGNLTSKRCPGVDPAALWSGPAARARKCASEELLRWWESNGGRTTYTEFRAQLVNTSGARRAAENVRLGGSGRDFGT